MSLQPFTKGSVFEKQYVVSHLKKENIKDNEQIELVHIKDNEDGTVNLVFRRYILGSVPELNEQQYNELMKNKKIELLGDTFVLNGEILTNNKYTTFVIDENKKLKSADMTNFYIGTNEYFITTCKSDFEITDYTSSDTNGQNIPILEYKLGDDTNLDYMSSGYVIVDYEFNSKNELINITKTI